MYIVDPFCLNVCPNKVMTFQPVGRFFSSKLCLGLDICVFGPKIVGHFPSRGLL